MLYKTVIEEQLLSLSFMKRLSKSFHTLKTFVWADNILNKLFFTEIQPKLFKLLIFLEEN